MTYDFNIAGVFFDKVNMEYIVEPYAYDDFIYYSWFLRCCDEWRVNGTYQKHYFQIKGFDGVFKEKDLRYYFDKIMSYAPFKPDSRSSRIITNGAELDKWCDGLSDVLPRLKL